MRIVLAECPSFATGVVHLQDKNGFCRDVNKDVRRHELRVAPASNPSHMRARAHCDLATKYSQRPLSQDMTVLSMGASTFKSVC